MNKLLLLCLLPFTMLPASATEMAQSLRGAIGVNDLGKAPPPERQKITSKPVPRDYPQQPPLIPHNVQGLLIQTRVNMCLACHARQTEPRSIAAKLPNSHFLNHEGSTSSDTVAPRRWFCVQCHVPQVDTTLLVSNIYRAPNTAANTTPP